MSEVLKSIWRDLQCLSPDKKSTLSFAFFLRYCNNITNLLFWVLWAYLPTHKQSDAIKLYKTFVFICRQKNNFIIHIFSGDIAQICKLLILGTLGMPGYTHPKSYYHLVEKFDVYLHAKNKLHHTLLSWDITF